MNLPMEQDMLANNLAETYFEIAQAFALVHARVRTKSVFYRVPAGTEGRVTGVVPGGDGRHTVEVTWDLTPPIKDWFSRREFAEHLELLPPCPESRTGEGL